MKKIAGLMRNVPSNEYSHNAAYARIWGKLLDAECEKGHPQYDADVTYIYIDINYSGSLNLFDGLSEDIYKRSLSFLNYDKDLFMLDHPMPDIGKIFRNRLSNKSTFEKFNEKFCDDLSKKCKSIKTITMDDMIKDSLVIGDSHSLSIAPMAVPIYRLDGKTLHGATKDHSFIIDMIPESVKKLTLNFGSIDIRHHLFRFEDPYKSADELLDRYFNLVKAIQEKGIEVEIARPIPVETKERKMAKTTMYKGNPFFGSRQDRLDITKYIINSMDTKAPCDVIGYPLDWYDMPPELFEKEIMERPRGIHIGYPKYRLNDYGVKGDTLESFFT